MEGYVINKGSLRESITDSVLRGGYLLISPAIVISFLRIFFTGWLWVYAFQILVSLALLFLFFFRHRFDAPFKIHFISVCLLALSVAGLLTFGSANSLYFSLLAVVVNALLLGKERAFFYFFVTVVFVVVIAIIFSLGIVKPVLSVDATSGILTWVNILVSISITLVTCIMVTDNLLSNYEYLLSSLSDENNNLAAQNKKHTGLLLSLPLPVLVYNQAGQIFFTSNSFVSLTGYTLLDLPDITTWSEKFFPEEYLRKKNMAALKEDLRCARDTGNAQASRILTVVLKNGSTRSVEVFVGVLGDDVVLTLFDVNDRMLIDKLLREQLAKLQEQNLIMDQQIKSLMQNEVDLKVNCDNLDIANKQLSELNKELLVAKHKAEENEKLKSSFIQNMSHEIRTPMNAIVGFTSLLNDAELNEDKRNHYIGIIRSSSEQLLKIVNDILDVSKIEAGMVDITVSTFGVYELMKKIHVNNRDNAQKKSVFFDVVMPDDYAKIQMHSDQTKVRQILENVVNNAIKFTDKGYVRLGFVVAGEHAVFYVEDSGIGIDGKEQERIFERFSQGDTGASRRWGGTGLGLSICKSYVELLGGTISLKSELSKGSRFEISLPLTKDDSIMTAIDGLVPQLTGLKDKIKIVVVEDEDVNLMYYDEMFSESGFDLVYFKEGIPAVDYLAVNNDVSLVVMDIKLPDISGFDAVKIMKKNNSLLPIIVVTAYASGSEKVLSLSVGSDYCFSKPVKRSELLGKIVELVSRSKG